MVTNGTLITPVLTDSVLESITRDTIIKLAKILDIPVVERTIDRTELYTCDEAFLCGSAMEITPVLSVDKYVVGAGEAGKITVKLHEAYLSVAKGANDSLKEWVTPIY
jgi:branched-chain amino acid aminotransferase